ncbi:hypothetical protein JW711_03500 [Candidatus Woesearchaeota archaeon]|nr:hypothetical protein [Candidatus Woesearchaeota archaeon]
MNDDKTSQENATPTPLAASVYAAYDILKERCYSAVNPSAKVRGAKGVALSQILTYLEQDSFAKAVGDFNSNVDAKSEKVQAMNLEERALSSEEMCAVEVMLSEINQVEERVRLALDATNRAYKALAGVPENLRASLKMYPVTWDALAKKLAYSKDRLSTAYEGNTPNQVLSREGWQEVAERKGYLPPEPKPDKSLLGHPKLVLEGNAEGQDSVPVVDQIVDNDYMIGAQKDEVFEMPSEWLTRIYSSDDTQPYTPLTVVDGKVVAPPEAVAELASAGSAPKPAYETTPASAVVFDAKTWRPGKEPLPEWITADTAWGIRIRAGVGTPAERDDWYMTTSNEWKPFEEQLPFGMSPKEAWRYRVLADSSQESDRDKWYTLQECIKTEALQEAAQQFPTKSAKKVSANK